MRVSAHSHPPDTPSPPLLAATRSDAMPYGFTVAADGAMLVPDKSEQTVIREIESLRATGSTLQRIAAELTERKVPTKTGRSSRWSHQAVARILARKGRVSETEATAV